ncbi:hypothetical protein AAFF_G00393030 [Aldrovandia affinis]|uniref:Uncharacterized protein n=1 Tax=Aldrovandia affinis TaxID=143900 RepID=A0AAD7VYK4_9TELE|nr:hypothetical protein AAFF_G00393030 [Aldrovandia affinis]
MRSIISIVLLLLIGLGVSSAQYVVLNGVVGQSVAFPDAVKKSGTLTHQGDSPQTIGDVTRGQFRDYREGRVHWNSATGLFSISGLKMEDSGMYALLNNDAERRKLYQYQMDVGAAAPSSADPLKPVGMFSIVNCVLVVCAVLGYLG